ncbi:NADP-dependent oxidoreductase [Streptomyces morookaense]|uniref:NADP-dependent oxidoreductase n=1 Tax=Streptomyces morookaense TaxID=1970 RepID=A0A7Y7B359_STRMO|nr:NADP-dependent oxidoreductase [Streptomyces morookaense]NVK78142.1 NADP-dependent oxidoreductase [Streptomyces morookaense]GHF15438.1 NADP-dependent oxidoreductase [Streptomyces morookaense]
MTVRFSAVHQVAEPEGMPAAEHFAFVTGELPAPTAGTALVENLYLSVDPYMRECMNGVWALDSPLEGRSIGRVIASEDPRLAVGDLVFHRQGWRTHALVTGEEARVLPRHDGVPPSAYLSILGGTGLSAYVALTRIARLEPGDSLYISAAAGGVGTAAGQLARILGAGRLIGSAGSAAKVRHLVEDLGFDAAFDYHDGPVTELLAKAAPDGVDVCLENVGGEHLEAAIDAVRSHGRIVWCGAVSTYNDPGRPPAAPRNLYDVVGKSIRLEGFLVRNYPHLQEEMEERLVPHIRSGALVPDETVADGFGRVVEAFLGMLRGENTGKMIVRLADA